MKIHIGDSNSSFDQLFYRLHITFPSKKLREEDYENLKSTYYNSVRPFWESINKPNIIELIERDLMTTLTFFPRVNEFYKTIHRYMLRFKPYDFTPGTPKAPISNEVWEDQQPDLTDDQAMMGLKFILQTDHNVANADTICNELKAILCYFNKTDFQEIRNRLKLLKHPTTESIKDTIFDVRRECVYPRWQEVNDFGLQGFPWQQNPSPERIEAYQVLQKKIFQKTLIKVEFKS